MKTIAVIPARAGSKGIIGKNSKLLEGRPLIEYTIEAALNSNIDKIVVSTDCKEIKKISNRYKIEVVTRPNEMARDQSPTLLAIQHALQDIDVGFSNVMTLQPTSPFRTAIHINESIDTFNQESSADSLVSIVEIPHNMSSQKSMYLSNNMLVGDYSICRRQEVVKKFARNGAIYITRRDKLSEYLFGGNLLPYFMDSISSIDIDDMNDWRLSELILRGLNSKYSG
jgi:CMP-N,N'-diacetyllegionaminic acid synthase